MNVAEYAGLDGLGIAELVRDRAVSPAEVLEAAATAVEQVNARINAVVEVHVDRIEAPGDPVGGALAGVPFMLKDISCWEKGRRCESGSRMLRDWIAPHDTELMRRFRRAGLINIGRTATSEFAGAATVETALNGPTRNPWDLDRSTSGSSGGSAAAVASGVVPIAHGTDGGGSIRMPASCCGVVGLKPTRGRITAAPAVPYPGDLSVDFAITRSIRDTAALLDAVAGASPGDPYSIAPPAGSYLAAIGERPETLRIAVSTAHMWQRRTDPEVAGAVEAVAALCEDLGHTVVEAAPTFDWEPYVEATLDVWCAMLADAVAWAAGETGRDPSPAHLEGHTRAWAERGRTLSAVSLGRAVQTLGESARAVGRFFTEYDVLLSATVPTLPIELGHYDPDADVPVGWYYDSAVGDLESTTSLFNCTGQPAISLPLRTSAGGLPIGIHFAAAFGQERTLLRLASALEEACPWATRRPSVWAADAI